MVEWVGQESFDLMGDQVARSHRPERQHRTPFEKDPFRLLPEFHPLLDSRFCQGGCDPLIVFLIGPTGTTVGSPGCEEVQEGRRVGIVGDPTTGGKVVIDRSLNIEKTTPPDLMDPRLDTQVPPPYLSTIQL